MSRTTSLHPRRPLTAADLLGLAAPAGCFFAVAHNSVRYYDRARSGPISQPRLQHGGSSAPSGSFPFTRSQRMPQMSATYSGLPAASSVEQAIIVAQLELLRRLDPARVEAAKAALLHK